VRETVQDEKRGGGAAVQNLKDTLEKNFILKEKKKV
jgi:hypothetical protein